MPYKVLIIGLVILLGLLASLILLTVFELMALQELAGQQVDTSQVRTLAILSCFVDALGIVAAATVFFFYGRSLNMRQRSEAVLKKTHDELRSSKTRELSLKKRYSDALNLVALCWNGLELRPRIKIGDEISLVSIDKLRLDQRLRKVMGKAKAAMISGGSSSWDEDSSQH